ncbi:MAG: hypothetical protein IRD3MM_02295 [Candidatus Midichloria mitochondrii]
MYKIHEDFTLDKGGVHKDEAVAGPLWVCMRA